MGMSGAIFLDKDGTVLEDEPYNVDPALMRFAPGALTGLRRLAATGMPLFVITNQEGVALGRFPLRSLWSMRDHLAAMFSSADAVLAGCYWCPHARQDDCACRKPRAGLLLRAAAEHGIDLERSWMIGDILNDVEAGRRAGCRTVLIDNGNETQWLDGAFRQPHYKAAALDEAAIWICEEIRAGSMAAGEPV